MNILQIAPRNFPLINSAGVIQGGGERSCLDIAEALHTHGHNVTTITHKDTCKDYVSGNILYLDVRSKKDLIEHFKNGNPYDLILFHLIGQSGLGTLTSLNIPTVMIWHMSLNILGISKFGLFESIALNRNIGGKLIGVSKTIKYRLDKEMKDVYNWALENKDRYEGIVNSCSNLKCDDGFIFQYIKDSIKYPVLNSNKIPVSIGQSTPNRNIKVLINSLGDKIHYFTTYNEKSGDYAKSIINSGVSTLHINWPYEKIQSHVGNYMVNINPCADESAGYAVFETAVKGVPSILFLNKDGKHASTEFFSDSSDYSLVDFRTRELSKNMKNILLTEIEKFDFSLSRRQELQDRICDKFTSIRVVNYLEILAESFKK